MANLDALEAELLSMRGRIASIEESLSDVRRERHLLDHRLEGLEGKMAAVAAHQGAQDVLLARLEHGIRQGASVAAGVPSVVVLLCELARSAGWL